MENKNSAGETNCKRKLVIISSEGAREGTRSPLLRFIRDYAAVLKNFEIHTTKGTGRSIYASGIYDGGDINVHNAGPEGGVVELAAMVARGEVGTVIFLSDPLDVRSDVPENFALQRVCRELHNVRLINTLASAEEWALCGGKTNSPSIPLTPLEQGNKNIDDRGNHIFLPVYRLSIALISHDRKKDEMVDFINNHLEFLSNFHRILATGTTGWLAKLLYATNSQVKQIEDEAKEKLGAFRFSQLMGIFWYTKWRFGDKISRIQIEKDARNVLRTEEFKEGLKKFEEKIKEHYEPQGRSIKQKLKPHNSTFVNKVTPLPSGPKGGDILIANEILHNECHRVVFFIDPGTAHPHEPDIRLLERTCQIGGVYAVCASDRDSASNSIKELEDKLRQQTNRTALDPSKRQQLCEKYGLRDAVIVDSESDQDSDLLGKKLARACAGYFFQHFSCATKNEKTFRIGISWGWATKQVIKEIKKMENDRLVEKPEKPCDNVIWSPIIGNLWVDWSEREAASLCNEFQDFFGGDVEAFESSGLRRPTAPQLSLKDRNLIQNVSESEMILISAAPWDSKASLFNSSLDRSLLPEISDNVAGVLSATFLDNWGNDIDYQYKVAGLKIGELRSAAANGAVLMMCGGKNRRKIAFAALKSRLISVLFTDNFSADWLLRQPFDQAVV